MRLVMTVDTRRCVGCQACVIACKEENHVPLDGFRDWVTQETRGRFPDLHLEIRSERCNHCDHPSCVSACPTGASNINTGGVVLVTPEKCTGCKACMAACPYGARYVHPEGYVDKCTFCIHRTLNGEQPACSSICPTHAIELGDLHDPESRVSKLLASRKYKVLRPEIGLSPNVFFLE